MEIVLEFQAKLRRVVYQVDSLRRERSHLERYLKSIELIHLKKYL